MPDTGENANAQLSADALGLNGPAAFAAAVDYLQVGSLVSSLAATYGVGVAAGYLTMEFGVPTATAISLAIGILGDKAYTALTGGYTAPGDAMGGYGYPGPNFGDLSSAMIDPTTGQGYY